MERALYSSWFDIPIEKIDFVRWGMNAPETPPERAEHCDYICTIGGNARDYATFMEALKDMPEIRATAVMRPHNVIGLDIPLNVDVGINLTLSQVIQILANSKMMVLPLKGTEVPCGHVTLVQAMRLGVPIVVTDSSGIRDYIEDGVTGVLCKPASPDDMRAKIRTLFSNPLLRQSIAIHAREFAARHCSEQNYVNHFIGELNSSRIGKRA